MDLSQLIYSSQPFGYDDAVLRGILTDARRNNVRDGITGALICRWDIFLQLLEGPTEKVQDTFNRIKRDDRHVAATVRFSEPVSERLFGDWAMLHDPARSWLWTEEELADGILDRLAPDDIRSVFSTLANRAAPEQER